VSSPYNGNASNATGTQVTVTDPVDGDDLTAASGTLPWDKLADWMQRLANIALNIATTTWTFTQAIVMQSTLAVTGAISGASLAVTGAVTAASATLTGAFSAATATFSGLLIGAAATFSGLLTANGGIAVMTPLVVGGTGVAFQNSFVPGTPGGPRYWKDAFGVVHIDGSTKNTTTPSPGTVFTLPSGYRPTRQLTFPVINVTASDLMIECVIETTGTVTIPYTSANQTVYLDGIAFPTF
jgi:hypothetical protein